MKRRFMMIMLVGVLIVGLATRSGALQTVQAADFNDDGFSDLAIGVPYETLEGPPTISAAGVVSVLYGSRGEGLTGDDDQFWSQNSTDIEGEAEAEDRFGRSLAAGDFNGDGYVDLAVGISNQTVDGVIGAGAVQVLYGTAGGGLSAANNQVLYEGLDGIGGEPELQDYFGWSVAAGDFNGDGYDELVIGIPFDDLGGVNDAGRIIVLEGTADGISTEDDQPFIQGSSGMLEAYEIGDHFGEVLTSGDWNADGFADLAVGVPDEDLEDPTLYAVGVVHIIFGSENGLTATDNQVWHQDSAGIQDSRQEYDSFGSALAGGDFDGDGIDDLAVGVPGQPSGSADLAGAVHMLYGTSGGLGANGDRLLNLDEWGGVSKYDDGFGEALAAGDFNGDGYEDLGIGAPERALLGVAPDNVGLVVTLYGSEGGLSTENPGAWHQGLIGLGDEPEENDQFGEVLAAGDFDGDGYADLAVGVPYEDREYAESTAEDAGIVHVLYGTADGLSGTGSQIWGQGAPVRDSGEEGDRFGYALAALTTLEYRFYSNLPLVSKGYAP